MVDRWPDAFETLRNELGSDRGRPAFVDTSDEAAPQLLEHLTAVVDEVVSLGGRVADLDQPPTVSDLVGAVHGSSTLMVDIDVLLAPELRVDALSQLRRSALNTVLIVAWPGRIGGGRVLYSLPGRGDHFDEPARDLVVLRPVATHFPDEIPYTVERYPA